MLKISAGVETQTRQQRSDVYAIDSVCLRAKARKPPPTCCLSTRIDDLVGQAEHAQLCREVLEDNCESAAGEGNASLSDFTGHGQVRRGRARVAARAGGVQVQVGVDDGVGVVLVVRGVLVLRESEVVRHARQQRDELGRVALQRRLEGGDVERPLVEAVEATSGIPHRVQVAEGAGRHESLAVAATVTLREGLADARDRVQRLVQVAEDVDEVAQEQVGRPLGLGGLEGLHGAFDHRDAVAAHGVVEEREVGVLVLPLVAVDVERQVDVVPVAHAGDGRRGRRRARRAERRALDDVHPDGGGGDLARVGEVLVPARQDALDGRDVAQGHELRGHLAHEHVAVVPPSVSRGQEARHRRDRHTRCEHLHLCLSMLAPIEK
ncbi:hypothetical protein ON010_g5004 [Phytophthora cinnamomi]|nr:hypothetical protein ON010_g5004 [Phytophthora cinnamomi]